jgi:DNA-binding transcriptional regulator YiaG
MARSPAANMGTIALADQLNRLRERVPLSVLEVARATGADETTVREWFDRKTAPIGASASRLAELIALVNAVVHDSWVCHRGP